MISVSTFFVKFPGHKLSVTLAQISVIHHTSATFGGNHDLYLVNPTYTKTVYGEGMPKSDGSGNGNLRIEFDIIFPERLSPEKKLLIKDALL